MSHRQCCRSGGCDTEPAARGARPLRHRRSQHGTRSRAGGKFDKSGVCHAQRSARGGPRDGGCGDEQAASAAPRDTKQLRRQEHDDACRSAESDAKPVLTPACCGARSAPARAVQEERARVHSGPGPGRGTISCTIRQSLGPHPV